MLELDSSAPTAKHLAAADIQAEILPARQQVQQVAYQQQDVPQGTPIEGVAGLQGQVFISRDPVTGLLRLTGAPEDVAIVRREIARLSREAKSAQPTPDRILLQNARGNLIQERVQEIYDTSYSQICLLYTSPSPRDS